MLEELHDFDLFFDVDDGIILIELFLLQDDFNSSYFPCRLDGDFSDLSKTTRAKLFSELIPRGSPTRKIFLADRRQPIDNGLDAEAELFGPIDP
jgi:hypothetical protein